ncbi:RND efflux membrane fusion protein precursor [Mesorhizobium alhagi CCNWXJ12-2]|jgi:membrane fusion protein (multidrug efflux system)|uniref:RND efflux membrane fusion protein n=2 Tax=Allomesorhizobium alhagi TaxID=475067 RepID=H0I0M1_9HYPH|nr:RND efflux membrane fusion protein precursor [Mesorhizobium alhagi CCNWXJ12-2]
MKLADRSHSSSNRSSLVSFMIKRLLIAFILLVLVVGGIVGFNVFRDRAIEQYFANAPVAAVTVSASVVEPMKWTPGIEAIGTVGAARGVDLTVETTGIIKDVLFSANQRVEQGAVLIQLDDSVERADLAAGMTQAALDKTAYDRALELQRRGVGTEVNVEAAKAAADASASQVAKFQAVLDQKQLTAPFSGTMGIPRIDSGQYIAPGTIVATLQDLDTMRVDFSIPEQQLDLVEIGQTVRLGANSADMKFSGSIIGIEPKVDPVSRLVSIRAEVVNPDGQLSPGQFVQVRVELPAEDGVLALPQTSVVSSLYGDYVFVVRPAQDEAGAADPAQPAQESATPAEAPAANQENAEPALVVDQVFVTTGRRSQGLVEVLKGIEAGDQIVTAGQNRLSNGTPVRVDNAVNPANITAAK